MSRPRDSQVVRRDFVLAALAGALLALSFPKFGHPACAWIALVPLFLALSGLALVKASCVGLFFMHLKYETKILRRSVAIPMSIPAFYALVLIAEGAWRRLPW